MIGLIQRVSHAQVAVQGDTIGAIQQGSLVLIGIEKDDNEQKADRLLTRLLNYRLFEDEQGKMNLSLRDYHGGLLLVPQFTLVANTRKGNRPSFSRAAPPEQATELFDYLVEQAHIQHKPVAQGQFGANMQVGLTNTGPVTFWLQV